MEFTLLDNGVDSLKKAKLSIDKFEEVHIDFGITYLKDSIIFLNHGVEILLKYILSKRNESLIFTDIKLYIEAKKDLLSRNDRPNGGFGIQRGYKMTVFDIPKGKNLRTITFDEAVKRIKYLCDIEVPDDLSGAFFKLNDFRDNFTHYTVNLTEEDKSYFISNLKSSYLAIVDFFEEQIPGVLNRIDEELFEITKADWEEYQKDMADFYHERAMSDLSDDDLN